MSENTDDLVAANLQYAERTARWRGRHVLVQYVYHGRGTHRDRLRAKLIDDTRIIYADLNEVEVY